MAQGSNDLNLLLKAKVVKIKVELDIKGSGLVGQVNNITKFLKDKRVKLRVELETTGLATEVQKLNTHLKDKKVKLGVELKYNAKDINKQINAIATTIKQSKTGLSDLKIGVSIDVKGTASKIKAQLAEINKVVQEFNKNYAKQIKEMQAQTDKATAKQKSTNAPVPIVNPASADSYAKSLLDAKAYMKTNFGKGLFATTELKDANGVLNGFVASLTKANGVVQKIRYEWDANAKAFTPINRQTITDTEKHVHKAKQLLSGLYADIEKLNNNQGKTNLLNEYDSLMRNNNLSMDAVKILQRRIKEESVLNQQIKQQNSEYIQQQKLMQDIKKAMKADWKQTNNIDRRTDYKDILKSVKKDSSDENLKMQELRLREINELVAQENKLKRESIANDKRKAQILEEIRKIEQKTLSSDRTSQSLISEIKLLAQRARMGEDWLAINKKMNSLKASNDNSAELQKSMKLQFKVEQQLRKLAELGKLTASQLNNALSQIPLTASRGVADLQRQYDVLGMKLQRTQAEMARVASQSKTLLQSNSAGSMTVKSMINRGDIDGLQKYLGQLYKGKIETIDMKDKTDSLGRAVTELRVKMKGTGKQVETYTLHMRQANNELVQTAKGMTYNANRNLGVLEQLKVAMARVPTWMVAMTAFYGTINSVKNMTSEILKLDKALTDLRRVASDSISIDTMFQGAVSLSKELGNNIHDVMGSIVDLARTFGDFNERQLLDITRTAVLMSNVSDLKAEEATSTLVGTMNAFNISASDSIRIVDALNEVDNDYAISTQQLATGLQKSASTARTFGVTLEENIGHITAIGAVTMESGNIIGNSLKTIYSRITTLDASREVLQGIGIEMTDMKGDTRDVADIIDDLGVRWFSLSKAQQQNIAVTVAGRYQLSRFLALMNNYEMATNATTTAIHSEGSAMRENAEYLKSFEARINSLKNTWTEFSNSFGNAILSDGLMLVIGLFGKLAEAGVWVMEKIGALPVVFGALAVALLSMGVFSKLIGDIRLFGSVFKSSMTVYNVQTKQATFNAYALANAWRAVTASQTGVAASARAMGLAWKSALIGTGIGAIIVGIGFAIEHLTGKMADQKREQEELEKLNNKMVNTYRKHRDGMDGLVARYEELRGKAKLTKDEQEELNRITKEFAEGLPTTVKYIDANGKAHLRSTEEIKKEIEAVKKLSKAKAEVKEAKFDLNVDKWTKDYGKIQDKLEDLEEKRKELIETDGGKERDWKWYGWGTKIKDNTKALQENKVKTLMAEAEKTEFFKKTTKAIAGQTLAYFEANSMMDALGDSQQALIESFMSQNEAVLRFSPDFDKAVEQMYQMGQQIGGVFVQAYDEMSKSIDPENTFQMEGLRTQLDSIAKTVPKSFLSLTNEQGEVVKSSADVVRGLKEIVNVSNEVGGAGAESTDAFIYRLMQAGLTADQAKAYLFKFSVEQDNVKIKSELAARGIDAQTASLEDLNEQVMEAIDLTASLFGYTGSDIAGMKSHLQNMHLLVDVMGEGAKQTNVYKSSQEALSQFLGVTATELEQNKDKYYQIIDALGKLNLSEYELTDSWQKFVNDSELSPDQKKVLLAWNGTKDIITGATSHIATVVDEAEEEIKNKFGTIFADAKFEVPDLNTVNIEGSLGYVQQIAGDTEGNIQKLLDKAGEFGIVFGQSTGVEIFDNLMDSLDVVDGKITNTEGNISFLKMIIATAVENPELLKGLDASLANTDAKINNTKTGINDLKNDISTSGGGSPALKGVQEDADKTKQSVVELDNQIKNTQGTLSKPFDLQLPTKGVIELDDSMVNLGSSADNAKGKVQSLVSEGSSATVLSQDINIVVTQIEDAEKKLGELGTSLKNVGDGFTTLAIKTELDTLVDKLKTTADKIKNINTNLDGFSKLDTSGFETYAGALATLYNNLALASTYVEPARQSLQGLLTTLATISATSNAHVASLSGLSISIGNTYTSLSTSVGTATTTIIAHYNNNAKQLTSLVTKTKSSTSLIAVRFNTLSITVKARMTAMSTSMNSEFEKGIVQLVSKASSMPKRIATAIRNNMGQVTSAMKQLSSAVSSANVQTKVPTYSFAGTGMLQGASNASGESSVSTSTVSTFGATSGDGGISSGGDSGTSGVITGSYNFGGGYDFYSLATKNNNSRDREEEKPAELYKPNLNERTIKGWEHNISMLEARMARLTKTSKEYRKALQDIIKSENKRSAVISAEIRRMEAENAQIQKRLKALADVNKHTKEQREEYNKLQQDFESNTDKLHSYKVEIENIITSIAEKSEEMFSNIIDGIIEYWDTAIGAIQKRVDDIDFEIEVLELTDPENTIAMVDLLAKKVRDLTKEQNKYVNAQSELSEKIREATKKHGATSEVVKKLVSQMEDYKEAWEDVRLEILRTEKEIKELRGAIADDLIKSFKKHYETVEKGAVKASNAEIDSAKKAHEAKMKMYDAESKRISEIYDQRIKAIDDAYNKETYEEELAEKSRELAELKKKRETHAGDTSLEGRKKTAEIEKDIVEKEKDLNDFIKKNQIDTLKEKLKEEKELQLEKVEQSKKVEEEAHETFIEQLEKERDAIEEHYKKVSDDEKKWSKLREELMKGNFKVVNELLKEMGINLEQMSDGTFNTLSEGFSSYSQEVRDFVLEINEMINKINSMTRTAYGNISVPSNPNVSIGEPINPYSVNELIKKAYSGEALKTPTEDKSNLYDMIKKSGITEYRMNEIWRKAQSGIKLDIPSPEHMTFYNLFEDILKTQKLKKFDTGGYTGDNVPKSGGLAILDNKELVLNDKQTSHILNAVKLLDKVKSLIPNVMRNNVAGDFATGGVLNNTTNYNLTVNIDKLNGDKSGATTVVKEIMKNLKKMGK